MAKKMVLNYIKKVFSNWWIYLSAITSFPDIISASTPLSINISLTWKSSLYLFGALLLLSGYFVWRKEYEELSKLKDKRPKLKLFFSDKKTTLDLEIPKIIPKIIGEPPKEEKNHFLGTLGILSIAERMGSVEESKACKDINKSLHEIKFLLTNEGEYPVEDIRVELKFPESFRLLDERPDDSSSLFIGRLPNIGNVERTFGNYLSGTKKGSLWVKKIHQTYSKEFSDFFVLPTEEGEFEIEYNIISNDSGSKGRTGKLKLIVKFKEITEEFTTKESLKEYEEKVEKLISEEEYKETAH